jgi:long-chain fatty acid transport protein
VTRLRERAIAVAIALGLTAPWLAPGEARAGGLFVVDRGVRPLGRGGAFVAGADDLGAIWYNPAGLADAGSSLLLDASWLDFSTDYTRQTEVAGSGGAEFVYTFPQTHGSTPFLPIPTIAGSYNFGAKKEWTLALGVFAPYTGLTSYPANAPSRYSLVSLDGSLLVETGAWIAYKPAEWFRIGAGFEMLVGTFTSSVVMNANPHDRLLGPPESTTYDGLSQVSASPIVAPSGNLGVTIVPESHVRIGVSGQAPTHISAPATVKVQLPSAPVFNDASQVGDEANVTFDLPPVLRAGVEVRPIERLRVEVAYVREFWSIHQNIVITPENLAIDNITGFPSPFKVNTITIPRDFQDSNSFRLGGEYGIKVGPYIVDARLGGAYETSAIPTAYISPLTVDLDKFALSLGGSFHVNAHWRFDLVYAHVFEFTTLVPANEAAVPQINPVRGNPTATESVNGGTYSARAEVLGVGVNYVF